MARVFITGSADGLGRHAADALLSAGHSVVVHARTSSRRDALQPLVARGASAVVGDLSDLAQMRDLAAQVNALGPMDAVIHNAGVYQHPDVFTVNVLAPYVLTALIHRPARLVYLSSGLHHGGRASLDAFDGRPLRNALSYADSKFLVTAFTMALARRWRGVFCNAVDPGWVPTKMGGPNAPDDLRLGHVTQCWLATSDDAAARTSGGYWHHQQRMEPNLAVHNARFHDELLDALAATTGVALDAG